LILALAKAIATAVAANKLLFPAPNPSLAQLTSDIAALDVAETATHTRATGTVETRNAKLAVVNSDLDLLRAYVQTVADADPANAASIATSAGMFVRKATTKVKQDLTAKPNKTLSGSVDVVVKASSSRESQEWQYSLDGKTWVDAPPTLQSKTTIAGFTPGTIAYFRHRAVTKTGRTDWSQPVSLMVH